MALKIVIDKHIPFISGALDLYANVIYCNGADITNTIVHDADALIIRTRTVCNAELLNGSSVKFIASATIGFDHIDTEYCKKHGIHWTNAPGCNADSVVQYVASALLYYAQSNNIDLTQRVLGVVGVGNVGKKIVRLAEALDMQVVLNDPPRERNEGICGFISLEGILREADIISFHVPLSLSGSDPTFHMCNEYFLNKINSGTLLINTSRGEVVDTAALLNAYYRNSLQNALLDVWEDEPNINIGLLKKVAIATPHIAGYSIDGKANGTTVVIRAISKYFDLGLDTWEPEQLPEPNNTILFCKGTGRNFQQLLTELVIQTYNVCDDMNDFMNNPEDFESLRNNYPVRREFAAYTLKLDNVDDKCRMKLRKLGFKID